MELFLRTMIARSYPRVVGVVRQPSWVIHEAILPLLSVSAFALVYRAMGAPEEFIGFVIIGGAMTAFWLNILWSMGAQLYWERDSGNLELFIIAPGSMMAILAGMALGGLVLTFLRAAIIVVAGSLLFQVQFTPQSWWALAAVFALTMLALYGLGMVFASLFLLWGREAWHTVNLLQEPVYLLSGMNYPVKSVLWEGVATAAAILPLTTGMDAFRQLLFHQGAGAVDPLLHWGWELFILAVLSAAFLFAAHWCLHYLERRAREEGRLTVKWQ